MRVLAESETIGDELVEAMKRKRLMQEMVDLLPEPKQAQIVVAPDERNNQSAEGPLSII